MDDDDYVDPMLGGARVDAGAELLATVRRREEQVRVLTEAAERNTRDEGERRRERRRTLPQEDGQGEEEEVERLGPSRNSRHGIRADSMKIFEFDGTDYHLLPEDSEAVAICNWRSPEAR